MTELKAVVIFTRQEIEEMFAQDFVKIAVPIEPTVDARFGLIPVFKLDEIREAEDRAANS